MQELALFTRTDVQMVHFALRQHLSALFAGLGPLPGDEWGFTGTFHKDNGGGFLTDHYPEATKACWDIEGVYCCSRHIPGVRFPGLIHPCAEQRLLSNPRLQREL